MTLFTKITALAIASVALAAPIAQASRTAPLTAAQTARLGAQTEAQGFKGIDRYLEQRYAEETAQAGADTEATSFKRIDNYLQQRYATQAAGSTSADGFRWTDAGIGAAVTAGIGLLALAGALVIRNRRHPNPGLPV